MNVRLLLLVGLLTVFGGCTRHQPYTATDIATMAHVRMDQLLSDRWFVRTAFKGFDDTDTANHTGTVFFTRQPGLDAATGQARLPLVNVVTSTGGVMILNDTALFLSANKTDTVWHVNRGIYGTSMMDQFGYRRLIPDMLIGAPYRRWNPDEFIISRQQDTLIDEEDCFVLQYQLKDTIEEQIVRRLAIARADSLPRWVETRIVLLGQEQYERQWIEPLYRLDMPDEEFGERAIPRGRWVESYIAPEERELLTPGTVPPDFERFTMDSTQFQLSAHKGEVVLLDFWYQNCPPCREAFPHLLHLHEQYDTLGLTVVGVNPIDPKTVKLERFIEEQGLDYTILPAAAGVNQLYKVKGYPTLYLIGRDGAVVRGWLGHGEAALFFAEVEKLVERELERYPQLVENRQEQPIP